MTPSIIRRFAQYHGIAIVADDGAMADLGYLIEELAGKMHGNVETESLAKVVQFLTCIECAEGAFVQSELTNSHPLHIYGQDLLLKAGITDLDKWEGTKK